MAETKTIKATCLCGSAKHEIILPASELPLTASFCHCNSCRHMTGAPCLSCIGLPDSYEPAKDLLEKLTPFQFSKRIIQYHCSTCGSQMLAHCLKDGDDPEKGSQWDVMSGTLHQADDVFKLVTHEYVSDTLDGGLADFVPALNGKIIPRWERRADDGEPLPNPWYSPNRPKIHPLPSDKLHAHCKCGGVNFWIARPSERSKEAAGAWPDFLISYFSNEPRPEPSSWWLRDNGTKFAGSLCTCNSCRLDIGMEFIAWCFIPTIDISLDAEGKEPFKLPFGTLKEYNSSPGCWRYFCGVCGASVIYNNDQRKDLVDVAVGILDAPEGARAENWLEFSTKRLSYREDSIDRAESLTLAIENGLAEFSKRHQA